MADTTLPDLPDTITRRVGTLPEDARRILASASVLGRTFDTGLLAATTGIATAVLLGALQEAEAAGLLQADGDGRFTFAHALVESTLYGSLDPARRCRLHRRAAEALEQDEQGDHRLAVIAHHLCCALPAGDRARAVEYAARAGDDAAERGAHEHAVRLYERALASARDDGGGTCLDPAHESALLIDYGDALLQTGATDRAREVFERAAAEARRAGEPVLLAQATIGLGGGIEETVGFSLGRVDESLTNRLTEALAALPPEELTWRAIVTARLAAAHYDAALVAEAQAASAEALDLARRAGDARALSVALGVRHSALSCPDSLDDRLALDHELHDLGRPRSVQALFWHVHDLLECGHVAEADAEVELLSSGSPAGLLPRAEWFTLHYQAMRASVDGDIDAAERLGLEARDLGLRLGGSTVGVGYALQSFFVARERGTLAGVAEVLDVLADENPSALGLQVAAAWARVETGQHDEARAQFEELVRDDYARFPKNGAWLAIMWTLASIATQLGDVRHARRIYELLLPYRDRFVVVSRILAFHGSVEHPLGTLALTGGDLGAAAAHLTRAHALHESLGAPILTRRTELALAELCDARGEPRRAEVMRAEIHADAVDHGWADLADDAQAAIDASSPAP